MSHFPSLVWGVWYGGQPRSQAHHTLLCLLLGACGIPYCLTCTLVLFEFLSAGLSNVPIPASASSLVVCCPPAIASTSNEPQQKSASALMWLEVPCLVQPALATSHHRLAHLALHTPLCMSACSLCASVLPFAYCTMP